MRAFVSWLKQPFSVKFFIVETFVWLCIGKFLIKCFPFKRIEPLFGNKQAGDVSSVSGSERLPPEALARSINRWVEAVSKYLPWDSNCLPQALAARFLLRCRGYGGVLFIGITKSEQGELESHAWMQCGSWVVTGAEGMSRFKVMVSYN